MNGLLFLEKKINVGSPYFARRDILRERKGSPTGIHFSHTTHGKAKKRSHGRAISSATSEGWGRDERKDKRGGNDTSFSYGAGKEEQARPSACHEWKGRGGRRPGEEVVATSLPLTLGQGGKDEELELVNSVSSSAEGGNWS